MRIWTNNYFSLTGIGWGGIGKGRVLSLFWNKLLQLLSKLYKIPVTEGTQQDVWSLDVVGYGVFRCLSNCPLSNIFVETWDFLFDGPLRSYNYPSSKVTQVTQQECEPSSEIDRDSGKGLVTIANGIQTWYFFKNLHNWSCQWQWQ